MSYALCIYPIAVMKAVQGGAEWEDVEDVLLEPLARKRVMERLAKYGYQLVYGQNGSAEYEKNFGGQPVQVSVHDTEIAFSTPYWDGLNDILFDLRMDVMELADSPSLAFYGPQRDEWSHGE